jgi:V/A-type H+-transporting ATPase subunit K
MISRVKTIITVSFCVTGLLGIMSIVFLVSSVFAQTDARTQVPAGEALAMPVQEQGRAQAFLAIAISMGLGSLAAGYAVGKVGSAAIGAITEKPETFGKAVIFVGLAEGIAIYGLIVAIMILARI